MTAHMKGHATTRATELLLAGPKTHVKYMHSWDAMFSNVVLSVEDTAPGRRALPLVCQRFAPNRGAGRGDGG